MDLKLEHINAMQQTQMQTVDMLLEQECMNNKMETWSKLDKTQKIRKLHTYADKYGKENEMKKDEVSVLKQFFNDCLDKSRLQKTKDVVYDKETHEIMNIPALTINPVTQTYVLKITDNKRVSTLKSLMHKNASSHDDAK